MVLTALKLPVSRITPYNDDDEVKEVKVIEPDWILCEREAAGGNICATWLGHAVRFCCTLVYSCLTIPKTGVSGTSSWQRSTGHSPI